MIKKFFGTVLVLLGLLIFVGSLCSCLWSAATNIINDGTDPRQTLTANLLGYERYAYCHFSHDDDFIPDPVPSGPYRCPLIASVRDASQIKVEATSSVGAFLSVSIGVWFELLLGLFLMMKGVESWQPDPAVPKPDPRVAVIRKRIAELQGAITPKQGELGLLREELERLEQQDGYR